jgi:flagellar biosynthetic protein FlhB
MSDNQDESQKTEDPTPKKLEDAIKKGQVVFSREVVSFFMFMALALLLSWVLPIMAKNTTQLIQPLITQPDSFPMDPGNLGRVLLNVTLGFLGILGMPMLVIVIAIFVGSMIQKPLVFTMEPAKPQLSRISPMAGAKRLFSKRSMVEFLKGLFKITLMGAIIYSLLMDESKKLDKLTDITPMMLLALLDDAAYGMVISVCVAMFFVACADYMYQRFEYMKNLRMSKQDIKDEYKQQEGDPHVKQRIRQLRRERAGRRMMAEVPQADVVITNPTHYAVALKYDSATMEAPRVVAKGVDKIALKIREIAEEHKIPVLRNPPLTRAIYESVEIDEPIKMEHYKAVAEVIGYVYRLKGKTLGGKAPPPGAKKGAGKPKENMKVDLSRMRKPPG